MLFVLSFGEQITRFNMSSVRFTSTKLVGSNKKGVLQADANGYYTMPIGGLNTLNSAGEYYTLEGAKQLFDASSIFMRRIKAGCLKAELGHPKKLPGMTMDDYLNRLLSIEETNVVAHFAEIWLDESFGKNNPQYKNPKLAAIMAKVKPAGPKGPALKESLENPQEDVCFSIRALTRDYYERGQTFRVLQQIVTFDNVTEPGIAMARKYDAPALESESEVAVRKINLERIISNQTLVATEDSKQMAKACLESIQAPELKLVNLPLITKW